MDQEKHNFKLFNTESGKTIARYALGQCTVFELPRPLEPVDRDTFIDDLAPNAKIYQFPKNSAPPLDAA